MTYRGYDWGRLLDAFGEFPGARITIDYAQTGWPFRLDFNGRYWVGELRDDTAFRALVWLESEHIRTGRDTAADTIRGKT